MPPTKAQHTPAYRKLRELLLDMRTHPRLTQRGLGKKLRKPQSWVYNCETGNRRVDVTEFIDWCRGCDVVPENGLTLFLESLDR